MAYFDINIFGTGHLQHDLDLFTFNLHILQVESDVTPTNFDMFIRFYAFPFNFKTGTILSAFYRDLTLPNPAPSLSSRFSVNKPQVIHLTGMTPNNPIDLYDCNPNQYLIGSCSPAQLSLNTPLASPCPNPEDIRLFSGTFCIPFDQSGFDQSWTNITNSGTGNRNLVPNVGSYFNLPISVDIIADGCVYRNKGKLTANIYQDYTYNYQSSDDPNHPYGNVDCLSNPKFYPIGYRDKLRVT